MLKEIMSAWADGSIMRRAVQELAKMVSECQYILNHGWETCMGLTAAQEIGATVREHDKAVNRSEREIRRILVEHLTINPGRDVSGCLALMIMAKDAERLGDHARTVFDLGVEMQGKAREMKLFGLLKPMAESICALLPKLERAILDSDQALAHEILAAYLRLKQDVRQAQKALPDTPMECREAVHAALLLQALRRVNAHIGNIASGVIFPLENIDFVSRGLRQEGQST